LHEKSWNIEAMHAQDAPLARFSLGCHAEGVLMSTDTATTPGRATLQHFTLDDLAAYTAEQAFGPTASPDFRVFYVGRDDVHGVLMHLFNRVSLSVKMNMFGYDDDDLNNVLMGLVQNPSVMVQVTLDKSQASGVHEKAILSSDMAQDAKGCANDFTVGESSTGQISHTKGGSWTASSRSKVRLTGRPQVRAPALASWPPSRPPGSRHRTTRWPCTSTRTRSPSLLHAWTMSTP
jgi:hypothetical protein